MDKYDKMTDETLNKAYADFKKKSYDCDLTVSDKTTMYKEYGQTGGTSRYYDDYIDSKTMINGYEIKPELMNKIKSFEDLLTNLEFHFTSPFSRIFSGKFVLMILYAFTEMFSFLYTCLSAQY